MNFTIDHSQAAAAPVPEDPAVLALQQMAWALQRLGQLQGGQIDALQLKSGVELLSAKALPMQALATLCRFLGKDAPKRLRNPDRAHLPMLAQHPELGWGVLVDQTPNGQWVLQLPQGPSPVSSESLQRACAVLQLGPKVQLGLGVDTSTKLSQCSR